MSSGATGISTNSQMSVPFSELKSTIKTAEGKSYTITPIHLCSDRAVQFLTSYANPFYRDGKPFTPEAAAARVKAWSDRFFKNEPWSAYLIEDPTAKSIIGLWTLGYDDEPGKLHMALCLTKQKEGIATAISKWALTQLLPQLQEKQIPIPVYKDDQCVGTIPIIESHIRAMTSPEHPAVPHILKKAGFDYVCDMDTSFGKRKLYEAPIAKLLKPQDSCSNESQDNLHPN